jgi:hypothetical protein
LDTVAISQNDGVIIEMNYEEIFMIMNIYKEHGIYMEKATSNSRE